MLWKEDIRSHNIKQEQYNRDYRSGFHLILMQCDDPLRSQLRNRADFGNLELQGDTIGLLNIIEEEGYSMKSTRYPVLNAIEASQRISRLRSLRSLALAGLAGAGNKPSDCHPKFD
jgi:hypothetical protein